MMPSSQRLWASRIMGGLPAVFLLVDGGMKLFKPAVVVESSAQLGYPESTLIRQEPAVSETQLGLQSQGHRRQHDDSKKEHDGE
jgi:hypothetical protein